MWILNDKTLQMKNDSENDKNELVRNLRASVFSINGNLNLKISL